MSENNHSALTAQLSRLRDESIKGVMIHAQTPQDLELNSGCSTNIASETAVGWCSRAQRCAGSGSVFYPRARPALLAVVGSMSKMTQKQIAAVSALL
ncbi:MAG: hypothetical protein ACSLEN_14050 [Candidatus Malihini olakiniferum]